MFRRVAVVGLGWVGFTSSTPNLSYKELMYKAAVRSYQDAGVDPRKDIDSFVTVAEDFHEGTSIFDEYVPDQLGALHRSVHTIPGDGLHGLITAYMMIQTGQFNIVAVEAHSKASNMKTFDHITAYAQDPIWNRPLKLNTDFIAGLEMQRFLHETGVSHSSCAKVAMKNQKNALSNPTAAMGADRSVEEILQSEPIAHPLLEFEKAKHVDGAIVLVLADEKTAKALRDNPVWIDGVGWSNGSFALEYRDWGTIDYVSQAAKMAYKQANISSPKEEIDVAEVDDIYAYKEIQTLDAMGILTASEANTALSENEFNYGLSTSINPSGGSLGVGHLVDATGLGKAMEIILQLRGHAGDRQIASINTGIAQAWRGVPTTSSAVAIFRNA